MRVLLLAVLLVTAACERSPVEVDHPFYLDSIPDSADIALFRCPHGPEGGCAVDGLPGPQIVAAGANPRFIVVAQQPVSGGPTSYFYFARTPKETRGWGDNPEKIVGPLNEAAFAKAKAALSLPNLTVTP